LYRKLQMFAEIAAESRSAVQDQSLNHVGRFLERDPNEPPPPTRNSMPTAFPPAHTNGPAVFDNSSDQELQDEADRVKGMRGDPMVGEVNMFSGQRGMNEAKGAWERLRNVNRLRSGEHPAIDGAAAPAESERTKEQREFDEMLEKERLGGGDWK